MTRYNLDPDDARDFAYEDAHDARYGERAQDGPNPVAAAALSNLLAARFGEMVLDPRRDGA